MIVSASASSLLWKRDASIRLDGFGAHVFSGAGFWFSSVVTGLYSLA